MLSCYFLCLILGITPSLEHPIHVIFTFIFFFNVRVPFFFFLQFFIMFSLTICRIRLGLCGCQAIPIIIFNSF